MHAEITLWGRIVGAVHADKNGVGHFEYKRDYLDSGIEVSPITMPPSRKIYSFPSLARDSFHGLPGLLSDSLPDKFGNALIDAWLATQGRSAASFNAIERLCYTGTRGMGALEFQPAHQTNESATQTIEVDRLVELASDVLSHRGKLHTRFGTDDAEALSSILRVGTSAGGARAKAVIAWNPATQEVRSGQLDNSSLTKGFQHWLIKFDGVNSNRDKELDDPKGYPALEYAYSLMAKAAGITMAKCDLLEENGRRHFLTQRFDRTPSGKKLHMQSLGALAHYDFNLAGAYSYEQAFLTIRKLDLGMDAIEEQFRRLCFNIAARNQDDHVKNIAFLMDKSGQWKLSPAYDITYSYNPEGQWTSQHQMSLNGKRDQFTTEDFTACGKAALMKRGRAKTILHEVIDTINDWPTYAAKADISEEWAQEIQSYHRLYFP